MKYAFGTILVALLSVTNIAANSARAQVVQASIPDTDLPPGSQEAPDKDLHFSPALDGFLGIKWGASNEDVSRAMKTRGFKQVEGPSRKLSLFDGNKFAGETPRSIAFEFYNGKFCEAIVIFKKQEPNGTIAFYDRMRDLLVSKYQGPKLSRRVFSTPFKEGDGYEETAISDGKASFYSHWSFDEQQHSIDLIIMDSAEVGIAYSDELNKKKLKAEKDEAKKQDL